MTKNANNIIRSVKMFIVALAGFFGGFFGLYHLGNAQKAYAYKPTAYSGIIGALLDSNHALHVVFKLAVQACAIIFVLSLLHFIMVIIRVLRLGKDKPKNLIDRVVESYFSVIKGKINDGGNNKPPEPDSHMFNGLRSGFSSVVAASVIVVTGAMVIVATPETKQIREKVFYDSSVTQELNEISNLSKVSLETIKNIQNVVSGTINVKGSFSDPALAGKLNEVLKETQKMKETFDKADKKNRLDHTDMIEYFDTIERDVKRIVSAQKKEFQKQKWLESQGVGTR